MSDIINPTLIDIIAEHFTGALVAHNSVCLQLGGSHATMARKFFETRKALGIEGYASKEQAVAALKARSVLQSHKREGR